MDIKINMGGFQELEDFLRNVRTTAIPFATKQTLNNAAFDAQREAKKFVNKNMILRNKWTARSIQVDMARGTYMPLLRATVGSVADYMADQEFGSVKRKKGKIGTPIATSFSSGEGEAIPRKKLPFPSNKLRKIVLQKRRGKNRKQKNLIAFKDAVKGKKKHIYMDLGKTKGIFKVIGGKRKPKPMMVQDLSNNAVTIPPNPWLRPSIAITAKRMQGFYNKNLQHQLNLIRMM